MKTVFRSGILLIIAATFVLPVIPPVNNSVVEPVGASSLKDQLEEIEKELGEIEKEKQDLSQTINNKQDKISSYQGEIGELRGEMETLQLEIAEIELQIEELEVNIKMLEEGAEEKREDIEQTEKDIQMLQNETDSRIRSNYMNYRVREKNNTDFFTVKDANTYFKDSQYKEIIQAETNEVINTMASMREELKKDKNQLEEQIIQIEKEKAIVDEQKSELKSKQGEVQAKIDAYYGAIYSTQDQVAGLQDEKEQISEEEAQKQAKAERIRQQIFNSFNSISSGQYVVEGTMVGRQGSTGLSTGPHVHFSVRKNGNYQNPCTYVPSGKFSNCSGNGELSWPLSGSFWYTSGYGNRCISSWGYCSFHAAIDIAHSTWNAPVYAAHDGWLYKGVDQYGAKYIIICEDKNNCNSGFKTGYWHLSSY